MSFCNTIYYKSLAVNKRNIQFWEEYLQNLKSIDFGIFANKLKVPALIPIGSRILFRGELKHTNEVTVALGADYFVKCCLSQAEILLQHRIKDAESKLETLKKERDFLENQITFNKQNVFENDGQEIIEVYTEDEHEAWRKKHRENVRKYKQSQAKEQPGQHVTDEELWERLEELELKEELENELGDMKNYTSAKESFIIKEEVELLDNHKNVNDNEINLSNVDEEKENIDDKESSNYELLQKVIEKQNELEEKLHDLRYKEKAESKTEEDLIQKLEEMEKLDELEDEMYRLDDIIETEEFKECGDNVETSTLESIKLKRKVSFAENDDDSETLELTFYHSNVEPCKDPYDPKKGIQKPSDIYEAYCHLFNEQTVSILKKSKYVDKVPIIDSNLGNVVDLQDLPVKRETILIKDVVEKVEQNLTEFEDKKRPISIFKKQRQLMKS